MDEAQGTFREEKCCIKALIRFNCWKTCQLGGHGLSQDRNIFFESHVKAVAARQLGFYLACVKTTGFLSDTDIMLETFKRRQLSNGRGKRGEDVLRCGVEPAKLIPKGLSSSQGSVGGGPQRFCWGLGRFCLRENPQTEPSTSEPDVIPVVIRRGTNANKHAKQMCCQNRTFRRGGGGAECPGVGEHRQEQEQREGEEEVDTPGGGDNH